MTKRRHDEDVNYYISLSDMMSGLLMIFVVLFAGFLYYLIPKIPRASTTPGNFLDLLEIPECSWSEPSSVMKVSIPLKVPPGVRVGEPLDILVETRNGSARADEDFIAVRSVITFVPGVPDASISLFLLPDDVAENTENFRVALIDRRGRQPREREIEVTLKDHSKGRPPPVISLGDARFKEPLSGKETHELAITMDRSCEEPVKVVLESHDGTASAGSDYLPMARLLTIPPGESKMGLPFVLMGDNDDSEGLEDFHIKGEVISGAVAGDMDAAIEIEDSAEPASPEDPVAALARVFAEIEEQKKNILSEIGGKLNKRLPDVKVELDVVNGVIRLPSSLLFDSGKDELQSGGAGALEALGEILGDVIPRHAADKWRLEAVFIEGHTDNNPINRGRFRDNWDLSAARSVSSYRAMLEAAPGLSKLQNKAGSALFSVSGYGEERPIAPNESEEGRQKNRRIDLRFVMSPPGEEVYQSIIR